MDRNTSNVSFYCRESKKDRLGYAPIELSIIINKERCYIRLPRKEKPEEFKTLVNSKKPNDLKVYLDLTRSRLNEIETDLIRSGYAITTYTLKEYFQHGGIKKYTVGDLFREYLGILKKRVDIDLTEKTYRKYELARDRFFQILGENMPVTSITNSVILDYMASLGNTYDQVTVVGYTQKIKTVVQFALDNDRMRINPFSTIHLRKGEKNVQYLTDTTTVSTECEICLSFRLLPGYPIQIWKNSHLRTSSKQLTASTLFMIPDEKPELHTQP